MHGSSCKGGKGSSTDGKQGLLVLQPVVEGLRVHARVHSCSPLALLEGGQLLQALGPCSLAHEHHLIAQDPRDACAATARDQSHSNFHEAPTLASDHMTAVLA